MRISDWSSDVCSSDLDSGNLALRKRIPQPHQGLCADLIATLEGLTRQELDALALESQQRAARAIGEGRFSRSLIPVRDDAGKILVDREPFPRPQTNAQALAALHPGFQNSFHREITTESKTERKRGW